MGAVWQMRIGCEAAMAGLARLLAPLLRAGDTLALSGELGAGKTVLARALIRALAAPEPVAEVPSPTYTLVQSYQAGGVTVHHFDLYRLGDRDELGELGWDDALAEGICLVEWPDRAGDALPADRLDIHIGPGDGGEERSVELTAHGVWEGRLDRAIAQEEFLTRAGWSEAARSFVHGDASHRTYERLSLGGRGVLLMNAPSRPDGPPVRDGKPYSVLAHLAEDVGAFVAIDQGLRAHGLSAPEIYAADLERGFLLLEDFGEAGLLTGTPPAPDLERYAVATDLLVAMRAMAWPREVRLEGGRVHRLPLYSPDALGIETELVLDWFAPACATPIGTDARAQFTAIWQDLFTHLQDGSQIWTLRDYHSPNLMWLAQRSGHARVGLLDFQDAVIGHPAYDLVSLLQDARVDVSEALEKELLTYYLNEAAAQEENFNSAAFARAYAVLGAQRNSKILGIFARLARRDGKPAYLRHLPRIADYLGRNLRHTALKPLAAWYHRHLPQAVQPDALCADRLGGGSQPPRS